MATMFSLKVLDTTLTGTSIDELRKKFSAYRDDNFLGASDIGAQFIVKYGGKRVGVLSYNGKYTEGMR